MPYLRMFLGHTKVDEVFISHVFVESILGTHFLEEEKQRMLNKHADTIRNVELDPMFDLFPPSMNPDMVH